MPLRGRPRLRRLAGIAGTTALILALFVAFLLVTPWGLTLGLRILSSALHGTVLAGHISFGDVDGGLLTGFRIDDVEMTDGRGEPLLRIDALEVDVAVRPLWDGRVEVERLRLASPVVWVDTSTPGTGWSTLAAPTDEPETPEPTVGPPTVGPPFPLAASIELSDATLIWVDEANPDGRERVRSLDVDASARYEAPAWDFEIASLRGEAEGQSVRIAAEARMTPVALVLSTVGLELAGATADASGRIELGGGLSALAEARVPPRWPLLPPDVLPRGGRARVDAQIGEDEIGRAHV